MNIGLFSSYGMKCGIAEYNMSLYRALIDLNHQITIFGNKIDTIRPERRWVIAEEISEDPVDVVRCFNAGAWSESGDFDFRVMFEALEQRQIKLIIVQYQNGIFRDQNLRVLFEFCKQYDIKVMVTFHDSCIGPLFPIDKVDHYVCTQSDIRLIVAGCRYIPQGIPSPLLEDKNEIKLRYQYDGTIVSTLGLGRTDYRLISRATEKLGYRFMVMDPTYSCRISGDHLIRIGDWLPLNQMISRLGASDAIVLWYPEIDAMVSSSAICMALATLRPIIVNDVKWFKDIPDDVVIKVKDEKELDNHLSGIQQMPLNPKQVEFVQQNQWRNIAQAYLETKKTDQA